MKKILSYMGAALVIVGLIQPVTHIPEIPVVGAATSQVHSVQEKNLNLKEVLPIAAKANIPTPKDNETIAWEFLSKHFTREQTAGIMGNLRQEHGFKTSDVPGGLGIAQWMGNRRANLIARGDYLNINVQLQFLLDELNGPEKRAGDALRASVSVEQATLAFSHLFERCGVCRDDNRIKYAYEIMGRHE